METLASSRTEPTAAECEAMIDSMLAEMAQMNAQMEKDRPEIERLKVETRAILAEMGARL